jgi:hypothetical protein
MAIDFPSSPTVGQTYVYGGVTYVFSSQGVWTTANASFAPLASPLFTGDPRVPTPAPGDNDLSIASTAFVTDAVAMTLLSTLSPGGGPYAIFQMTGPYDLFQFEAHFGCAASRYLCAHLSVDGGSTYLVGGSDYSNTALYTSSDGSSGNYGQQGGHGYIAFNSVSMNSPGWSTLTVKIHRPQVSGFHFVIWETSVLGANGYLYTMRGSAFVGGSAAPITTIRFLFDDSASLFVGNSKFKMYGIK